MSTKLLKPNEKFKLIFYAKIESKPIQQIKKMGRNLKTRNNRGNLEIEKEKLEEIEKKKGEKKMGGNCHTCHIVCYTCIIDT